jgi:hypothetical protein
VNFGTFIENYSIYAVAGNYEFWKKKEEEAIQCVLEIT